METDRNAALDGLAEDIERLYMVASILQAVPETNKLGRGLTKRVEIMSARLATIDPRAERTN